jgi:hypothetical protein
MQIRINAKFLPQFSHSMLERLEDKGHNVAWLAEQVDATYEHLRKIAKGIAFPSRRLLKDICRVLGLNEEDMWRLVISDKLRDKYGEIPTELAGKSERMLKMERLIDKLTPEQFKILHGMAEGLVNQNRRTK